MFLKIKKINGQTAALITVAAWFCYGALENTFVNYPRTPNQLEGRIVPYAAKGIVVYITQAQQRLVSWTNWTIIGSASVALFVILIHGGDPFRERLLASNWPAQYGDDLNDRARKSMIFLRAKNRIAIIAVIICIAAWFYPIVLTKTFVQFPRVANQEDGRIVHYTVNGIVVYMTQEQQRLLSWINWIVIGSVIAAVIVMLIYEADPFKAKE